MNNLKNALARDGFKKYQKSKIEVSGFKKSSQWSDIDFMMQKKTDKHHSQNNIEQAFRRTIEGSFSNGQLKDVAKLHRELKQRYKQFYLDQSISSDSTTHIIKILDRMTQEDIGAMSRKYVQIAIDRLEAYYRQSKKKEKEHCLDEYNKLMKKFKPIGEGKVDKVTSKLFHSTSATNLKIRLTRQEYHFQQDELSLKRKKSMDVKNKSKISSNSQKNLQGTAKLQQFLKDTNLKLVKTKVDYDYSAIFEASKSNIQSRNRTTINETKTQKQGITKATNGKKNQAFVFYRPHTKKL